MGKPPAHIPFKNIVKVENTDINMTHGHYRQVRNFYYPFSYIIDEEIKKNITITPALMREDHLYLSVGHVVTFHLEPSDQGAILLHYKSKHSAINWKFTVRNIFFVSLFIYILQNMLTTRKKNTQKQ